MRSIILCFVILSLAYSVKYGRLLTKDHSACDLYREARNLLKCKTGPTLADPWLILLHLPDAYWVKETSWHLDGAFWHQALCVRRKLYGQKCNTIIAVHEVNTNLRWRVYQSAVTCIPICDDVCTNLRWRLYQSAMTCVPICDGVYTCTNPSTWNILF